MYSYISENDFGPSNQIIVPTGYKPEHCVSSIGEQTINCKSLVLQFMHAYEIVQFCFCHVGAAPYTTLIQPQQHFTFSGIAGWVPVELYIVVRRVVGHNN